MPYDTHSPVLTGADVITFNTIATTGSLHLEVPAASVTDVIPFRGSAGTVHLVAPPLEVVDVSATSDTLRTWNPAKENAYVRPSALLVTDLVRLDDATLERCSGVRLTGNWYDGTTPPWKPAPKLEATRQKLHMSQTPRWSGGRDGSIYS